MSAQPNHLLPRVLGFELERAIGIPGEEVAFQKYSEAKKLLHKKTSKNLREIREEYVKKQRRMVILGSLFTPTIKAAFFGRDADAQADEFDLIESRYLDDFMHTLSIYHISHYNQDVKLRLDYFKDLRIDLNNSW